MRTATRIEVVDPNIPDKPLTRLTVPGEIVPDQVKKEVRIGVTLKIDLGDKVKKKTVTVKIHNEELKNQLEEYVDSILLRMITLRTEEAVRGEISLKLVKSE